MEETLVGFTATELFELRRNMDDLYLNNVDDLLKCIDKDKAIQLEIVKLKELINMHEKRLKDK